MHVSYIRGFFYATTILLGLIITFQEFERGNILGAQIFTIGLTAIFAIEIISGWYLRHESKKQVQLALHADSNKIYELLNHLVIPSNVFFWTITFGFFNLQQDLRTVSLAITFFTLALLFTNIRAFYTNEKRIYQQTVFIFDLAQIYILFLISNTLVNSTNGNLTWTPLVMGIVTFMLLFLNVIRSDKLELLVLYLSVGGGVVLSCIVYLGVFIGIQAPLRISLLSVSTYYLISAFVHHVMERDLTKNIVIEYVTVLLLALVLLQGLS